MDIQTSIHGRQIGLASDGSIILNKKAGFQSILGLHADKIITSAQLLALFATPIAVVPAPGAGLIVVPRLLQLYKPAGTAYAGIAAGEDLVLKYTDASGAQCSSVVETTGFLDQTTAEMRVAGMPGSVTTTAGDYEPVANAAVVLHLLTAEITTGDSDLIVRVFYDIHPSTLPTS